MDRIEKHSLQQVGLFEIVLHEGQVDGSAEFPENDPLELLSIAADRSAHRSCIQQHVYGLVHVDDDDSDHTKKAEL